MGRARCSVPASLVALGAMAFGWGGWVGAAASPVPEYDFDWAVIGSPGNRAPNAAETPLFAEIPPHPSEAVPGSVSYEYQITKDKVTVGQWFEFVQAYTPYYQGTRLNLQFTGRGIGVTSLNEADPLEYFVTDFRRDRPAEVGFEFIQRYINWLHNDKGTELEDFEQGVYDMNLGYLDPTPAEDARFRLPTLGEWTKAVYYDPNRYGEGVDGYWLYPNGTNEPLISGVPGVGQTSAGDFVNGGSTAFPIRSYPDQVTPWGLFDASGGVEEYTDTGLYSRGSGVGDGLWQTKDRLDAFHVLSTLPRIDPWRGGFRVVSVVPGPSSAGTIVVGIPVLLRRKRRHRTGRLLR